MLQIQTIKVKQVIVTPSTATNHGYDAVAMTQEERWTTVRSYVTVKEV